MGLQRRDFLKIVGATTVATALPGCGIKQPKSLIPYVIPEESIIPGKAVWYASVCQECPAGCGVSVRVREGRAVKVEGNPLHPVNRGALCARGQASLHGLYNPDRIQQPLKKKPDGTWEAISWDEAEKYFIGELVKIQQSGRDDGIAFMTQHMTGAVDELVDRWISAVGSKKRYRYEPFAHESIKKANQLMFGVGQVPAYNFAEADTVMAFGADFLETWISPVEFTKDFSNHRGFKNGKRGSLYFVGPRLSLTATNADEWFSVDPGTEGIFALGLVKAVLDNNAAAPMPPADAARIAAAVAPYSLTVVEHATGIASDKILKAGLAFARAKSGLAVAGGTAIEGGEGAAVIAAVHLLNYVCGNVGKTMRFTNPGISRLNSYMDVAKLVDAINLEEVSALVLAEVNPVFTTPQGLEFGEALKKVPFTVSLSSFMTETSSLASLILPTNTPMESWGDAESEPGVYGLMQPAMQPVFKTKMLGDILLETGKKLGKSQEFGSATMYDYTRERWRSIQKRSGDRSDFESFWVESLARGGYWNPPKTKTETPRLSASFNGTIFSAMKRVESEPGKNFALIVYPSINHYDGRGANRPWLQELPDPMMMNVWDSWIEIHPQDAAAAGISTGDAVQISSPYAQLILAAQVTTAVKPGVVAIPIGQGHTSYGRYADNVGMNPIDLLDPKPSEKTGGLEWSGMKLNC